MVFVNPHSDIWTSFGNSDDDIIIKEVKELGGNYNCDDDRI